MTRSGDQQIISGNVIESVRHGAMFNRVTKHEFDIR